MKLLKRQSIKSVALLFGSGSDLVNLVPSGTAKLRQKLRDFDAECIFNVDETGLFFDHSPRRTYIFEHYSLKSVLETKYMRAKDRITTYF